MAKIQALRKTEYTSFFVYLPSSVLDEAGITKGDDVSVTCEKAGVVMLVKE